MKELKFSRFTFGVLALLAAFVGLAFVGAKLILNRTRQGEPASADAGLYVATEQGGAAFETGAETRALNLAKQKELDKLEWLDQAGGTARIPIGAAMKIITQRSTETEKSRR